MLEVISLDDEKTDKDDEDVIIETESDDDWVRSVAGGDGTCTA